jgi:hypothetical protein
VWQLNSESVKQPVLKIAPAGVEWLNSDLQKFIFCPFESQKDQKLFDCQRQLKHLRFSPFMGFSLHRGLKGLSDVFRAPLKLRR